MNSVLSFFQRQQGLSNRLTYDVALSRLCVPKEDSWKGITPSNYSLDYNPEPPIFAAKFADCESYRHILAIANEDGKIALHNTNFKYNNPEEQALEGQQCHFNAVFDLEWAPGQMRFLSASGDHSARLWDVTPTKIQLIRSFSGHTRSVKTAAFRKNDSAVFATGGRDGAILIWDARASLNLDVSSRADKCIYSGHAGAPGTPASQKKKYRTPKLSPNASSSSITGLVFQDDMTLVSCGAGDGVIKVWDLRRNYTNHKKEPVPKFSLPYSGSSTFKGFTNLLVDKGGVKLYANCMDNVIYCYNLSSYSTEPVNQYVGLRNDTFYIKSCLSPDGNYLISGSSDEKAYIWNLNNPQPLVALCGHTVEVTCVAWSGSGGMPIVTCSDDARHKIWRIGPEKISADEKINYRGHAEQCKDYSAQNILRTRLKDLEHTPRSLRRIVEENEKTPSSVEKVSTKRTFSEMNDSAGEGGSDQKRPHIETRGRRLFSPSTSFNMRCTLARGDVKTLGLIQEEGEAPNSTVVDHPEDSNQENSLNTATPTVPPCSNVNKVGSPLMEKTDFNLKSPNNTQWPSPSTSSLFSPTSNLPNYVLDGEAPHLHIMSPKRKLKDKVDWLTRIRKQKLMTSRGTSLTDKISNSSSSCSISSNNDNVSERESKLNQDTCQSPRLQSLRASESSPKCSGTPKRRISHSGSHSESSRTPTSSRRNSETSILKFFTISTQSQAKQDVPTTSNLSTAACSK